MKKIMVYVMAIAILLPTFARAAETTGKKEESSSAGWISFVMVLGGAGLAVWAMKERREAEEAFHRTDKEWEQRTHNTRIANMERVTYVGGLIFSVGCAIMAVEEADLHTRRVPAKPKPLSVHIDPFRRGVAATAQLRF